jgi:2-oxoisovalerate dehydrogenase E1 component beta subunit
LLIASIEDDDPVVFLEPKRLYNGPFDGEPNKPAVPWSTHPKGEVPDGYYTVPIGKAEIVRKGSAVTIVTYGTMVYVAKRRRGRSASTRRSSTCARWCRSTSTRS